MIYDFNTDASQISIQNQGGKFFFLYQLHKLKTLKIPEAICISDENYDRQQLEAWLDNSKFYAVRSSANQEDLKGRSAAGVFESYLNRSGLDSIRQAIERCFSSVHSDKVQQYLEKIGASENQLRMNVIIQQMIPAEKSGVLFTVNPVSGKDELYIQMVDGIAEKLVSGYVNPRTEIISKSEPPREKLFKELWQAALLIEHNFQSVQDIEWAWYENQLYILQTRPLDIRAKSYPPEQVWTRANIGEIIPKPLTPLSWDIFQEILFKSYRIKYYSLIDRFFTNLIHLLPRRPAKVTSPKMFNGHIYLNLDTIFRSFGLEPYVSKKVMQAGLGFTIPSQSRAINVNIWDKAYTWIKKLIFRIEQVLPIFSMESRLKKFIDSQLRQMSNKPDSNSLDKMIEKVRFLFGWHIAITARSFSHFGFLIHKSQEREDYASILSALVKNLSQNQPQSYLHDFERFVTKDLTEEELLKKIGHRSINEFELSQPAWKDQPDFFKTFVSKKKIQNSEKTQSSPLSPGFPTKRKERFQASINLREELKSELIRYYREIQKYYLAQAEILKMRGKLVKSDDIFFLKKDEVSRLIKNQLTLNREIETRRTNFEMSLDKEVPNTFYGTDLPDFYNPDLPNSAEYKGIGCSEGVVSGTAFIVSSYADTANVTENHIVITRSADPGWTPVLLQCKGMVAEVGGILSHIATIARENNVPMIVGLGNITGRLKTGQQITIDGSAGTLSIHSNGTTE